MIIRERKERNTIESEKTTFLSHYTDLCAGDVRHIKEIFLGREFCKLTKDNFGVV
jgi:hypothetical protein